MGQNSNKYDVARDKLNVTENEKNEQRNYSYERIVVTPMCPPLESGSDDCSSLCSDFVLSPPPEHVKMNISVSEVDDKMMTTSLSRIRSSNVGEYDLEDCIQYSSESNSRSQSPIHTKLQYAFRSRRSERKKFQESKKLFNFLDENDNFTQNVFTTKAKQITADKTQNIASLFRKAKDKFSFSPRFCDIEASQIHKRKRKAVKQPVLSLKERISLAAKKQEEGRLSFGGASEFPVIEEDGSGSDMSSILIPNPKNKVVERVVDLKQLKRAYKIGCGQFGSVDCVEYEPTGEKYALKVISKGVIDKEGIIENLIQEKETLLALDSPFIIKLYSTLQSEQYCFFLLELVKGGEFYQHLLTFTTFSEPWARFYAANVSLAFDHMHQNGIVYRDLKPENVMLKSNGYLKLIDLGFAKIIGSEKTYTYCGTADYLAPEMVEESGHDQSVDWWGLGIFIFEMLIGRAPFKAMSLEKTCKMITSGKMRIPECRMSSEAENIIRSLCKIDSSERLGYVGVRTHPWLCSLNWSSLEEETLSAPYIPKPKIEESTAEVPYENYVDNDGLFERF